MDILDDMVEDYCCICGNNLNFTDAQWSAQLNGYICDDCAYNIDE